MMRPVHVVAAARTPLGKAGGGLAGVRPDDLAAAVLTELMGRAPTLDPAQVDDIFWGAANQAGEDNRNVARMAGLLAGLPESVPGVTVNRLCASGLEAIVSGARAIATGEADICLAGGSESMSRAPYVVPREAWPSDAREQAADTRLGWRLTNPRMTVAYPPLGLGETAEEVALRWQVDREAQDEFALRSHQRAAAARDSGAFDAELFPVAGLDRDEGIRGTTSLGALAGLAPAFRAGGTVTAGNSSPLSDGAAGVVLVAEDRLNQLGLSSYARYVGSAAAGVHPDVMGIGPVPATEQALHRVGWSTDSVGLVELNEAFAAQSVAVIRSLHLDPDRVNVHGGAIALGHPLGCSGARLVVTLVHALRAREERRGAATMCVGVGQGLTALFEAP